MTNHAGAVTPTTIFVIRDDELVPLQPRHYENEAVLQTLIARYPNLLAGDAESAEPRRWLLIRREGGIPDSEETGTRWAVDHVFVDQDGIPTLVEVKLVRDTRIRRLVIGQMLDYAANAVVYWPVERLRDYFQHQCEDDATDPDTTLAALLAADETAEGFWQRVDENLRSGRLRLVFVADEIPRELRRVIEFLNTQMTADVFGIEVKRYVGDGGLTTLVPAIIGQTAAAETRKQRPSRPWNEETFFAQLENERPTAEVTLTRQLYDWTSDHGWIHNFGSGTLSASWSPTLVTTSRQYRPITITSTGLMAIGFASLATRPPFDQRALRLQLLTQLNEIPTITLDESSIDSRYPTIPLQALADPAALAALTRILEWLAATAQQTTT